MMMENAVIRIFNILLTRLELSKKQKWYVYTRKLVKKDLISIAVIFIFTALC